MTEHADNPAPEGVQSIVTTPAAVGRVDAQLADLDDRIAAALQHSLAPNTWRAYAADWRHWSAWAGQVGVPALPAAPLDLARYLVAHAGQLAIGTLSRRLSAVSRAHVLAGHADPADDPAVREVLRGLRRQHGTARRPTPALWTSDVEGIIASTLTIPSPAGSGQGLAEVRDRAALLLAFTTALRRSELVALDVADLEPDPAGLVVHVRRSKTDQTGDGSYLGVAYATRPSLCAVRAVQAWLAAVATEQAEPVEELSGPLLQPVDRHGRLGARAPGGRRTDARLSGDAVRAAVVRRATAAGLTPSHGDRFFTAHSTRSGFATQAAANGATEAPIMAQGRWRSLQVARGYIRRRSVFTDLARSAARAAPARNRGGPRVPGRGGRRRADLRGGLAALQPAPRLGRLLPSDSRPATAAAAPGACAGRTAARRDDQRCAARRRSDDARARLAQLAGQALSRRRAGRVQLVLREAASDQSRRAAGWARPTDRPRPAAQPARRGVPLVPPLLPNRVATAAQAPAPAPFRVTCGRGVHRGRCRCRPRAATTQDADVARPRGPGPRWRRRRPRAT